MFFDAIDDPQPLVADLRLPAVEPFTARQALARGITRHGLERHLRDGSIRRILRGVYVDATVPDSLEVRARALALVVPVTAVVADATAAWLRGVSVLAPGDHLQIPPVSIVRPLEEHRVRTGITAGGLRGLRPGDVEILHGVRVTTALRTALDLGRLWRRDQAIGSLDALLRTGDFTPPQLLASLQRFKGFRGVRQLRELVPLADARSESPGESVLRLRWLDAGLPAPELQIPFLDRRGHLRYRGDLGLPRFKLLAEYDGAEFHSSPEQRAREERRRAWIGHHGWVVVVLRREDVYGPGPRVRALLRQGLVRAQRRRAQSG